MLIVTSNRARIVDGDGPCLSPLVGNVESLNSSIRRSQKWLIDRPSMPLLAYALCIRSDNIAVFIDTQGFSFNGARNINGCNVTIGRSEKPMICIAVEITTNYCASVVHVVYGRTGRCGGCEIGYSPIRSPDISNDWLSCLIGSRHKAIVINAVSRSFIEAREFA